MYLSCMCQGLLSGEVFISIISGLIIKQNTLSEAKPNVDIADHEHRNMLDIYVKL